MSSERPSSGLPSLRWPPLSRLPPGSLSAVLLLMGVSLANALVLRFEVDFVYRARVTEVLVMMGHARKEIALERAQRPASRSEGNGDPVALTTTNERGARSGMVIRYTREGDRVVARFSEADRPDEQGVWVLSPVDVPGASDWVSNWRCTSRSSGKWQHIAQSTCPDDGPSR
jgi:hypothetical protein